MLSLQSSCLLRQRLIGLHLANNVGGKLLQGTTQTRVRLVLQTSRCHFPEKIIITWKTISQASRKQKEPLSAHLFILTQQSSESQEFFPSHLQAWFPNLAAETCLKRYQMEGRPIN